MVFSGELKPCSWEDAIISVAKVLDSTPADRMAAIAGGLSDAEVCSISIWQSRRSKWD